MRVPRQAAGAFLLAAAAALAGCGSLLERHDAAPAASVAPAPAVDASDAFEAIPGNPPRQVTLASIEAAAHPGSSSNSAHVRNVAARRRLAEHIARSYRIGAQPASQIVDTAYRQGLARHLRPTLLLAVIAQESSFRSDAVSAIGAVGLMQIRPELHEQRRDRLGLAGALTDPAINIAVGADVLHEFVARNDGDVERALAEYSGGARNYPLKVARIELDFARVLSG